PIWRQHAAANNLAFRSDSTPPSRRNASIVCGSWHNSHSDSVMVLSSGPTHPGARGPPLHFNPSILPESMLQSSSSAIWPRFPISLQGHCVTLDPEQLGHDSFLKRNEGKGRSPFIW